MSSLVASAYLLSHHARLQKASFFSPKLFFFIDSFRFHIVYLNPIHLPSPSPMRLPPMQPSPNKRILKKRKEMKNHTEEAVCDTMSHPGSL